MSRNRTLLESYLDSIHSIPHIVDIPEPTPPPPQLRQLLQAKLAENKSALDSVPLYAPTHNELKTHILVLEHKLKLLNELAPPEPPSPDAPKPADDPQNNICSNAVESSPLSSRERAGVRGFPPAEKNFEPQISEQSPQNPPSQPLSGPLISEQFRDISEQPPQPPQPQQTPSPAVSKHIGTEPQIPKSISEQTPRSSGLEDIIQAIRDRVGVRREDSSDEALADLQRRRSGRPSALYSLSPDLQKDIFELINDFGESATLKAIATPAPEGWGLKTSKSALHRFHDEYPKREAERLLANSQNRRADFQKEILARLETGLLALNLDHKDALPKMNTLIAAYTKLQRAAKKDDKSQP